MSDQLYKLFVERKQPNKRKLDLLNASNELIHNFSETPIELQTQQQKDKFIEPAWEGISYPEDPEDDHIDNGARGVLRIARENVEATSIVYAKKKYPELVNVYQELLKIKDKTRRKSIRSRDRYMLDTRCITMVHFAHTVFHTSSILPKDMIELLAYDPRDEQIIWYIEQHKIRIVYPFQFSIFTIHPSSILQWLLLSILYMKTRIVLMNLYDKNITIQEIVSKYVGQRNWDVELRNYASKNRSNILFEKDQQEIADEYFKKVIECHDIVLGGKSEVIMKNITLHASQRPRSKYVKGDPLYVLTNVVKNSNFIYWEILCNKSFTLFNLSNQKHLFANMCINKSGHWTTHPILKSICSMEECDSPVNPEVVNLCGMFEDNVLTITLLKCLMMKNVDMENEMLQRSTMQSDRCRAILMQHIAFLSIFDCGVLSTLMKSDKLLSPTSEVEETETDPLKDILLKHPLSYRGKGIQKRIAEDVFITSEVRIPMHPDSCYRWSVFHDLERPARLDCHFESVNTSPKLQSYTKQQQQHIHPLMIWNECSQNDMSTLHMAVFKCPLTEILCKWLAMDNTQLSLVLGKSSHHTRLHVYRAVIISLLAHLRDM